MQGLPYETDSDQGLFATLAADRPRQVDGLEVRACGELRSTVVVPGSPVALVLDATESLVLRMCDGLRSAAAIATALANAFPEAPRDVIVDDVAGILTRLRWAGCLRGREALSQGQAAQAVDGARKPVRKGGARLGH